ncbi:Serine/threonine-protein kinase Nek7 [Chamberlinius hualienensis]
MPLGLKDFDIMEAIGCGGFGNCHRVRRKVDSKIMVMKTVDYSSFDKETKQLLCNEVNLIRQLDHPHVIKYYGRFINQAEGFFYILTEYCEGGDLAEYIRQTRKNNKAIDEAEIWEIFCQLAVALDYCHNHALKAKIILHRDVKPANVFRKSPKCVVLGDFGISRFVTIRNHYAQTVIGTISYMSPECLNNAGYNATSDVWSLGCLIYELCCLRAAFSAPDLQRCKEKILIGKYAPIPPTYSEKLKKLIKWTLTVDPAKRPSSKELTLCDMLQPIFKRNGFGEAPKVEKPLKEANKNHVNRPKKENLTERELRIAQREKELDSKTDKTFVYTLNKLIHLEREKQLDLRARFMADNKFRFILKSLLWH